MISSERNYDDDDDDKIKFDSTAHTVNKFRPETQQLLSNGVD